MCPKHVIFMSKCLEGLTGGRSMPGKCLRDMALGQLDGCEMGLTVESEEGEVPHLRWSQAPPLPWPRPGSADIHTHIHTLFCLFGDYYPLLESQYPHGPIMVGPAPKKTKVQVASLDAQQFRPLTELWRVERFPTMKLVAGGFQSLLQYFWRNQSLKDQENTLKSP